MQPWKGQALLLPVPLVHCLQIEIAKLELVVWKSSSKGGPVFSQKCTSKEASVQTKERETGLSEAAEGTQSEEHRARP